MAMRPTCEALGRRLNDVELRYAPKALELEGDGSLLSPSVVKVSVVGSRNASIPGLRRASKLARLLAEHQVVVVGGLARGIDTAAHRGALEAGGRTIAVLGTGVAQSYPLENRGLQDQIRQDHLLVSQFPADDPPRRHRFPLRNRTMALITDATVIIEAGESSGTLHQGWEALRLARPLFLLNSLVQSGLVWPDKMLDYGARILYDIDDLMMAIPSPGKEEPLSLAI